MSRKSITKVLLNIISKNKIWCKLHESLVRMLFKSNKGSFSRDEDKHKLTGGIDQIQYYFCTAVNNKLLLKAIALHSSLQKNQSDFQLWICCLDEEVYSMLEKMKLHNTLLIHVWEIEDNELSKVKKDVSASLYYWVIKAPLVKYIMLNNYIDFLVYCDADIYFFSNPSPVFNACRDTSIFLCKQRCDHLVNPNDFYQLGIIGIRKDENLCQCLNWWRTKSIQLCYKNLDTINIIYELKSMLNIFPLLFPRVKLINDFFVDAKLQDIINNNRNINLHDDDVYIDEHKLISYDFENLSIINESEFDLWNLYTLDIKDTIIEKIYVPYIKELKQSIENVKSIDSEILSLFLNKESIETRKNYVKYSDMLTESAGSQSENNQQNFCTLFDKNYLVRGLALYYSLQKHSSNFHLWICCMDEFTDNHLSGLALENVTILKLANVEDDSLLKVKSERSVAEYCWTLKAPLIRYILEKYQVLSMIYCDADIYFFSDPEPIDKEWQGHSILLCRRRDDYELQKIYGLYQTSLIGFKNDEVGMKCVDWWRERCIEACSSEPQPEKSIWRDQKYMDRIPYIFSYIKIAENHGINAALWSIANENLDSYAKDGEFFVKNNKLIAYHFAGELLFDENRFNAFGQAIPESVNIDNIYTAYSNILKQISEEVFGLNLF